MKELLELMEKAKNERNELIDKTYENVKQSAENGNDDAKQIINVGAEKEIKKMINESIEKATA